mgnify:CR=1 FL=1
MQKTASQLDESALADWAIFDRGFLKGEALEKFINQQVGGKPIEGLKRKFAVVATDLADGKAAVFIPGIKSVDDIAAIAVKQPGKPLVWRRVTVIRSQN